MVIISRYLDRLCPGIKTPWATTVHGYGSKYQGPVGKRKTKQKLRSPSLYSLSQTHIMISKRLRLRGYLSCFTIVEKGARRKCSFAWINVKVAAVSVVGRFCDFSLFSRKIRFPTTSVQSRQAYRSLEEKKQTPINTTIFISSDT